MYKIVKVSYFLTFLAALETIFGVYGSGVHSVLAKKPIFVAKMYLNFDLKVEGLLKKEVSEQWFFTYNYLTN